MKNNKLSTILLSLTLILSFSSPLLITTAQAAEHIVYTKNPNQEICAYHSQCPTTYADSAQINITQAGNYKIYALTNADSFDEQLNESFYLEIRNNQNQIHYPLDPNAGQHFVVADYAGNQPHSLRYAGTFYFDQGLNSFDIKHYYLIAGSYNSLTNGDFSSGESVAVKYFKLELMDEIVEIDDVKIHIDKQVDKSSAEPNDYLIYTLNYSITGNGTAKNVVLTDNYTQNYLHLINQGGAELKNNHLIWQLGDLEAGTKSSKSFKVKIKSNAYHYQKIFNYASISADNAPTDHDNVYTLINKKEKPTNQRTRLKINKYVSDSNEHLKTSNNAETNEYLSYIIEVTNIGEQIAENVEIIDNYDENKLEIITRDGGHDDHRQIIWHPGSMAIGETIQKEIRVRLNSNLSHNTKIYNYASANASNASLVRDSVYTKIKDSLPVSYDSAYIEKFVSDNNESQVKSTISTENETLTYEIIVTNNGNSTLKNLEIIDDYNQNYLNIISDSGATDDGNLLKWHISSLRAGKSITKKVTAKIKSGINHTVHIENFVQLIDNSRVISHDRVTSLVEKPHTLKISGTVLGVSTKPTAPTTGPGLVIFIIASTFASLSSAGAWFIIKRKKTNKF